VSSAKQNEWLNKLILAFAVIGIISTFFLQEFTFISGWNISENARFVVKKTLRVLLNDFFMLIFISAWFNDQKIIRLAILIGLIDGLFLLPIYLYLKLSIEGTGEISIPLLSLFHRLIINPTLMILLIPAVYFQRMQDRR
jgi:exosortase F-associated protein